MTPVQLRVLIAVAEHGGFTVAADHLGMSQPAVSRAVTSLERELGAALFVRHRDGIALTEAGKSAVDRAREALRHFDLIHADVAAAAGRITGELRLASLPSATGTLIAPMLRAFADRYPQVRVRLFEGVDDDIRAWLRGGAAEVGVVTLPVSGLHTIPLSTHDMVAVVPAGHPLSGRAVVRLGDLAGHPFILTTAGCRPLITAAAHSAAVELDVAFEASGPAAILEMVAAGLGVSIVPTLGLPADLGNAVTRPIEPRTTRSLALALPSMTGCAPAARAFIETAAESGHLPR
ncbi:LysR family transcriptional regulator [Nonomuraea jiangxiensis]|uniref:DNA-binding transcriptional regulator, LysR family n=1 Tax=Nonomuraea jiangxiensis TaxID=633440 RepID=A0A1G9NCX8_9ACTN|nr:LysR family transcriptional regulator [Nonomuraea jiangxiensis]SDL84233.1 DNA-binding transcriptional regulator, LysR family [Nonomuraea jiangxiensis]